MESTEKMDLKKVRDLLISTAAPLVGGKEAKGFADLYLDTHMKKFPRMNPLEEAVKDIQAWKRAMAQRPDLQPEILSQKEGVLVYDFHGLPPSLKMPSIHGELERRAKKNGVAAAGIINGGGIISLGFCADGLAHRDLIGIASFNGGTQCCVPHGGCKGVFGTNPLCYAIPTTQDPICLDMATTQIPFFDLKNAKESATPLPKGCAVDSTGNPTTRAAEALTEDNVANLLPLGGGYKGYGLVMLLEILTGALLGSPLSPSQTPGWNPQEYGCFILAIDISGFTNINTFKAQVDQMGQFLRALPPAQGHEGVSIPGDRANQKIRRAREQGQIIVKKEFEQSIKALV